MNSRTTPPEWRRVHEQLVRLSKKRAELDFEEARWLVQAEQQRVHTHLGFGSLREYLGSVLATPCGKSPSG